MHRPQTLPLNRVTNTKFFEVYHKEPSHNWDGSIFLHMPKQASIGVFDSGYGGLSILKELIRQLPDYDYTYLGDNARAPYGTRSFETVYRYTWQAVDWFFEQGCPLVILACNTASAKALRSIQQQKLPQSHPANRVLGVIRPSTEAAGEWTKSGRLGILATAGTVASLSYPIEIAHFYPQIKVFQQACPMWVPLVENNEFNNPGADYFIQQCLDKLLQQDPQIDSVLLACTHYPLLEAGIRKFLPPGIRLISQGPLIAQSLREYLGRHPEMEQRLSRKGSRQFFTTDSTEDFDSHAPVFFGQHISSAHVQLD